MDGSANAALVRLLARRLGVAPSTVSVAQGARGRDKVLVFAGLLPEEVRARLAAPSPRG